MAKSGLLFEDWQQVKAIYYGMISHLDHHLGRVLDALESTGRVDDPFERNAVERELLEEALCTLYILPVRHQNPAPIPKKWIRRANQS